MERPASKGSGWPRGQVPASQPGRVQSWTEALGAPWTLLVQRVQCN